MGESGRARNTGNAAENWKVWELVEEQDGVGAGIPDFFPLQIPPVTILCLCCSAMGPNSMSEINEDFEIQTRNGCCSFGRQHQKGFMQ